MSITTEMAPKPTTATNTSGVDVATAWREFREVLSGAAAINPDAFSDAVCVLTLAASHLEALGLDATELDDLIGHLESVTATLDHVEVAISDLLAREPADWPKAGFNDTAAA